LENFIQQHPLISGEGLFSLITSTAEVNWIREMSTDPLNSFHKSLHTCLARVDERFPTERVPVVESLVQYCEKISV